MTLPSDATCDPALRSWVSSANRAGTDFPVQNLPFGVFHNRNSEQKSIGVAIGDEVVNLRGIAEDDLLAGVDSQIIDACREPTLNALMSLGRPAAMVLRLRLSELLRDYPAESNWKSFDRELIEKHLLAQADVRMMLPASIGDYTDFYASIEHATRAGGMFRPEQPLLPNYRHLPVGYHGRASSIVPSGTAVRRPRGQWLSDGAPVFAPTQKMDFEAELGFFVGKGNAMGAPVALDDAAQHLFGCCLLNDWSARDIQAWEYQPLGPFLGKSFATTISPWIVTMDALAPFRIPARQRQDDDPSLLPYLSSETNSNGGGYDIKVEASILTADMRSQNMQPMRLADSHAGDLYWTAAQLLTHHTSNGCNLRPGDLLGTGTLSGKTDDARACMLELTHGGREPVQCKHGEQRGYLEDGDEVILRGYCLREGLPRIGFGACRGILLPEA